ncbi:hypothetical protein YC2023_059342 [Brassica napus]
MQSLQLQDSQVHVKNDVSEHKQNANEKETGAVDLQQIRTQLATMEMKVIHGVIRKYPFQ